MVCSACVIAAALIFSDHFFFFVGDRTSEVSPHQVKSWLLIFKQILVTSFINTDFL